MFSRIRKEGDFTLSSGVKSSYNYDYSALTDTMNEAYCHMLKLKLDTWQSMHGKFNVVIGCETEGIRIGYVLSKLMGLPFHIMENVRIDYAEVAVPSYPTDTHWLIVDDIVTTGSTYVRAVNYLNIEEKPESITFACMIKRNPANMDYSSVRGEFHVPDERQDFIDKHLVALHSESE